MPQRPEYEMGGGFLIEELSTNVIANLILGAVIFLTVLAWADLLRLYFSPPATPEEQTKAFYARLYYSLTLTGIAIVFGLILYVFCYHKAVSSGSHLRQPQRMAL